MNNVKKNWGKQKTLFPSIYRIITDYRAWIALYSASMILATGYISLDLYKNLQKKQQLEAKRQKILQEIDYWQKITSQYKGYRDGYFTLATLEYELNQKKKASEYLKKTLELDPNFEEGRKLEKLLQ